MVSPARVAAVRPKVDLLLDPFGASWAGVRDAALVAEEVGFDGLWTWDHLAGQAHGADRVLECWTVLSALAAVVPRVVLGPMVLNVANRRPALLATMAATLQEVSGGRLLLGIGAGGGKGLPYPKEQEATGVAVPGDPVRRQQVREAVEVIRQLWTGEAAPYAGEHYQLGRARGFIVPEPFAPPVIVGAFGPKMAALAGRYGDGINTGAGSRALPELLRVAWTAHAATGRDPATFIVTVSAGFTREWLQPARLDELARAGVNRVVLLLTPPFEAEAIRAAGLALRS
jgi:alkanesulfonate monooxygenase SsuD/methylene tetrahydromethanopterin reductase-like flavin-dependent oxidoreductase (luciferase family)